MTTKPMKGYEDSFIVEGKMALPYTYFAGRVGSKFITTIRDQKKIMGVKCPACNTVYLPPRQVCDKDFTDIRENWVEVGKEGTVTNFTVVRYDDKHLPRKAPFRQFLPLAVTPLISPCCLWLWWPTTFPCRCKT